MVIRKQTFRSRVHSACSHCRSWEHNDDFCSRLVHFIPTRSLYLLLFFGTFRPFSPSSLTPHRCRQITHLDKYMLCRILFSHSILLFFIFFTLTIHAVSFVVATVVYYFSFAFGSHELIVFPVLPDIFRFPLLLLSSVVFYNSVLLH